jgi:hypothetical protein
MKNQILFNVLKNSRPKNFYSDEQLSKINEGIESESLKNELLLLLNEVNYNPFCIEILISKCSSLLNSVLEKRDELKSIEVLLLNQSINKILRDKRKENEILIENIKNKNINFLSNVSIKNIEFELKDNLLTSTKKSSQKVEQIEKEFENLNKVYKDLQISNATAGQGTYFRFMRNSTAINIGDAIGSRSQATNMSQEGSSQGRFITPMNSIFLDSPATTSATTYKLQTNCLDVGTMCINRSGINSDGASYTTTVSSITVMEIAA